jgi:hypothetical protein
MRNFWKYPFLISGLSFISLLVYMLVSLALYGNQKVGENEIAWIKCTLFVFAFSLIWAFLTSISSIANIIKEFLKD